jgi:hypothetical protein
MGRGDRHKVRWAHDRGRKKKQRDKRQTSEKGAKKKA